MCVAKNVEKFIGISAVSSALMTLCKKLKEFRKSENLN